MNIGIAGLGLIGGSLALALRRAGHVVVGKNRSRAAAEYALAHGVVDSISDDLSQCDVVFVALPPAATIEYICTVPFSPHTVVADICGVKQPIERAVCARRPQLKYVGTHPMAGKEVSGVGNASADLFVGASMVLTSNAATDAPAYALIGRLTADMGFAHIVECSAEVHDKKISYTSQLAHIVSNAYVRDDEMECCSGFTGGSFQDMTRIAGVEEGVWAELYTLNRENVSERITNLCANLEKIKRALLSGEDELRAVLKEGRERFTAPAEGNPGGRIEITEFKGRGS